MNENKKKTIARQLSDKELIFALEQQARIETWPTSEDLKILETELLFRLRRGSKSRA